MRRYWTERITALACIGIAVYFGILAFDFPAGGGDFPHFAAAGTIVLALLMLAGSFVRAGAMSQRVTPDFSYAKVKPLLIALLVVLYVLAIFRLGYYTASILFLAISTGMVGIRNVKAVILTGVILFPAMYAFFEIFLHADLPRGVLF